MKNLIRFSPVLALSMLGALSGCAMQSDSADLGDEIAAGDEVVGEAASAVGTCTAGVAGCVSYFVNAATTVRKGTCTVVLQAKAPGGAWITIPTGNQFLSSTGVGGIQGVVVGSDPNGCIISQSFAVVSKTVASAQVAQYALFNTAYGAIQADFGCNAVRTVPAASAIHTLTADLLPKTVQVTTSGLVSAVLAGGSSGKCTWINSSSWLAVVPSGATAISSATGLSFL